MMAEAAQTIDIKTHGQQLLLESRYSAAEVAKLLGVARQRVSEWRRGTFRPDAETRKTIAKALPIPASAWDVAPPHKPQKRAPASEDAPTTASPSPSPSPAAAPEPQLSPPDAAATIEEIDRTADAIGLEGIPGVIAKLRAMRGLPPREQVACAVAEGRLHDRAATLRAKQVSAREEFFASPEFAADVALLASAFRASTAEIRTRLARFGVELPLPEVVTEETTVEAPTSEEDVEDIVAELQTAKGFADVGEAGLAAAHIQGLGLDVHGDQIAVLLVDRPELAARVLGLLPEEGPDHRFIRSALERRLAVRAVVALPKPARVALAALLELVGHAELAKEIAG